MKYLLRLMGLRLGWTTQEDGSVYDPTKLQFPSEGFGEYVPFDGTVTCSECGRKEL